MDWKLFPIRNFFPSFGHIATEARELGKYWLPQEASEHSAINIRERWLRSAEIRPKLRTPSEVYRCLAPTLSALNREVFEVLCLNKRNTLLRHCRVAEGTVDSCPVDPREVFALALGARAAAIVLAHNHPSGSAEPSAEDLVLTKRLAKGAELLGIRLLDHLIIAEGTSVSLLERGHIPAAPTSREVAATP